MKKTLAILLSCILLVCAFFAVALITSADTGTNATSVTVIKADGTVVFLGQQPIVDVDGKVTGYDANKVANTTLAAGEGSLTFDVATGVLTMNNATGIAKIQPANGDATVTVVGDNTVDSVIVTDNAVLNGKNALWNYTGSLTVNGSGSLKVLGASYLIGSQVGDVVIDGPTLDVTASDMTAVHTGADGLDGSITIKGKTVLTINSKGPAFDAQGITPAIYVGDDAKLTLTCESGNAFNINANRAVTAEIPNSSSTFELSGNAQVSILKANVAVNAVGIANNNHSAIVKISDSANLKAVTTGQGIVVNAQNTEGGGVQAVLQITGQTNVDIDTTGNKGNYGQGIDIRPGAIASNVDITTTGEVKVKTCAAGWSGAFFLRNKGSHDVLIKDATLTVENTSSDQNEVVNAIYAQAGANIVVAGNAKVTAVATQNSTVKTNRAFGIYLAANSSLTVQDNATVVAKSSGTARLDRETAAAAVYLNASAVNVTGNASLTASTTVSTASALATENVNALNVSGKGSVVLESEKARAIYAGGTPSVSVVEGGSISAKGATSASNLKAEQVTGIVKGDLTGTECIIASKTIGTPAGLAYTDVTASSVKLTWNAVAEAAVYKVYANGVLVATVDKNEVTVTPLVPETAYSVTVTAANAADLESAPSAAVTFTTLAGESSVVAPAVPTGLAVSGVTKSGATVSWTAVEGATSYDVYVNGTKVNETALSDTTYALTGLTANTAYKVSVSAANIAGSSEKSSEVSFTTGKDGVTDSVTVTFADGTTATLSASNPSVSAATGTIVFNSLTGEVTVTDVTGVQSIIGDAKSEMTVVAKGTNVLETATQTNSLKAGYLVIAGDGKLTVTNTYEKAYPILGQSSVTVKGSVDFVVSTPNTANAAIHISRGAGTATGGVATLTICENAKVTVNSKGSCLQPKGEYAAVVITDNAVVNLTGSDGIQSVMDTDAEYTGTPKAYVEISGKAKVTVNATSCGIRCHYALDGSKYTGLAAVNGCSEIVIKDKSVLNITSSGQCVYAVATPSNTTGTDSALITISGTPTVTLNNTGDYAGIHLNGDSNTLTVNGGAIEITAPNKSAFAVNGKTTYVLGENVTVMVAGKDKDSAEGVAKINTTAKYFKIYYNNPSTSDVSVAPVAVMLVLGAVAVAAAIVLRKRSYNA